MIGGLFHIYGLLIGIGVLLGYQTAIWYGKRIGFNTKIIDDGLWWALIPGIIGARLYHVIDLQEYYFSNPLQIIKVWEGGLGIWGAIIGGLIGIVYFCRIRKLDLLQILDIAVVGVPLAQAIGRWGNFFNKELYGKNGEPLFLYESCLNLILFGLMLWLSYRKLKKGFLFATYLIGYGVIRMYLETFRPNEIIWTFSGVPVAQIVSLLAIGLGGFLILKRS